MAESKLVQLNFENNIYSVYSIIFIIYAFSMLSLDCILISDFVVADFFMHSLPGMILLCHFLHRRCFCIRYYHFFKINDNCWEHHRESTQHTAVELFTLIKHTNLTLYLLIITHQLKSLAIYQNEIYTIRKPIEFHTNTFKPLHLVKGQRKL